MRKLVSALLVFFLLHGALSAQKPARKPNIIFILADDLGWGELGCYGNTYNETPNLDKLSTQGLKFTQAYSAAPICSPSRVAIMTGQYPARTRITDFLPAKTDRWLDPSKYLTINEALSNVGYYTGMFGKWHLDTDYLTNKGGPKAHGFDEVIGTETKYIADGDYFFPYDKINTFTTGADGEYLTDRQSAEACRFIERNQERPFFLYLPFYAVHTKLDAPEDLVNKYKKKFDAKYGEGEAEKYYGAANPRHEADHRDNPYLAAMLERIDAGVGQIMQTLAATGLDKNTLLVFFSDNGGAGKAGNNGFLRAGKSWLYEGGIRECLLMRWPGKIAANTVTNEPMAGTDFYPTFLEVAGTQNPPGNLVDGKSIVSLMMGKKAPAREAFYWHYPSETGKWKPRMASAVRKGDYKLIEFYLGGRLELYDLKTDPSEKHNLATEMPEKVKELKEMLDTWKIEVNAEIPDLNAAKGVTD
ncbi:sulfatase [Flavisolibacter nicotianae]|uniref:sulfatase n=1 Tax=Flavisolibacter nicotianae TaxID=2364882 RepID=UPI000EAB87A7|nr:sulfatase [Flavisolibacter nicotianae]